MRKILSLLALLMLICPGAQALTLPYPEDTVLSVMQVTDAQRALAEALYNPVFNHVDTIPLPEGTRYGDVAPAMHLLMQDYPELFHLGQSFTVSYYRSAPETAVSVTPQYRMSKEEAAAIRTELYVTAYLLADANPDPLALHDALCAMVTYGGDTDSRHTAAGALLEGRATCEGYAQALSLLYRMAGIPCGTVLGTAQSAPGTGEPHAWNIARLNDCTLIDPTWNDQNSLALCTHWYYGLSTGQMGADHTPGENQAVPPCDEQDNFHLRQGLLISTLDEADTALRRLCEGETVNLRFTDDTLYRQLADDSFGFINAFNKRNPDAAFRGTYSMIRSDAQRCVILQRTEE